MSRRRPPSPAANNHSNNPAQPKPIQPTNSQRGFEQRDLHGDTALTLALQTRHELVVVCLLEHGAEPNPPRPIPSSSLSSSASATSDSPLHVAIKTGMPVAARALVEHGAAWHVKDCEGSSPLPLAIRYGMYALAYDLLIAMATNEEGGKAGSLFVSCLVDESTGESVVGLCLKAGQLEMAALVLDMGGLRALQEGLDMNKKHESVLHDVMKLRMSILHNQQAEADEEAQPLGRRNTRPTPNPLLRRRRRVT
ncbi:hypothetical protein AaE_006831, partial [Aphanomyces astaci]